MPVWYSPCFIGHSAKESHLMTFEEQVRLSRAWLANAHRFGHHSYSCQCGACLIARKTDGEATNQGISRHKGTAFCTLQGSCGVEDDCCPKDCVANIDPPLPDGRCRKV
jgi:hypothetical protein